MCILTYVGRGYTPAFVERMDQIIQDISHGVEVCLVEGSDDICAGLQGDDRHCERPSVTERDNSAMLALLGTLDTNLAVGTPFLLTGETLSRMRDNYLQVRERTCGGCEWFELCSTIAGGGFLGTKLQHHAGSTLGVFE